MKFLGKIISVFLLIILLGCHSKPNKSPIDFYYWRSNYTINEIEKKEVDSLLAYVFRLGEGDLAIGTVKAFELGIIDIPFGFKLSELDLKIPLCFMEHCMVTIFEGTSENKIHNDSFSKFFIKNILYAM